MSNAKELQDHLNKAEGYLALSLHEDALAEAAAAVELDPASYPARFLRGIACISLDRLDEARASLMEAVGLEPDRPETYVHLAYIDRRTVSLDAAIETIHKALELKPGMPLSNYNLACYLAVKGDPDEALLYLRRAVNVAPHFREIARADEDFDTLRPNPDFRRLVEMD